MNNDELRDLLLRDLYYAVKPVYNGGINIVQTLNQYNEPRTIMQIDEIITPLKTRGYIVTQVVQGEVRMFTPSIKADIDALIHFIENDSFSAPGTSILNL